MITPVPILLALASVAAGVLTLTVAGLRPAALLALVALTFLAGRARGGPAWLLTAIAVAPTVLVVPLTAEDRGTGTVLLTTVVVAVVQTALCYLAARLGLRSAGSRLQRR